MTTPLTSDYHTPTFNRKLGIDVSKLISDSNHCSLTKIIDYN
nr:MAG TPA: hypothetical protein [Caudoviricetes sp.]